MAVKRISILLIIAAAVITIAAVRFWQNSKTRQAALDDKKFMATFAELAIAKEEYKADPDSFRIVIDRITTANNADSAWMENHIKSIDGDHERYERIWEGIVSILDSLKNEKDLKGNSAE